MAQQRHQIQLKQWQIVPRAKSASFAILGLDSGVAFTNDSATGAITGTLPKAAPGLEYRFFVSSAHTFTVAPQSIDTIRGHAINTPISNGSVGSLLRLVCIIPLFWEVELNIGPFT